MKGKHMSTDRTLAAIDAAIDRIRTIPIAQLLGPPTQARGKIHSAAEILQHWDRHKWSAMAIDFRADRPHWQAAVGGADRLLRGLAMFFAGEHQVAGQLARLSLTAPDPQAAFLLTIQASDEVLHSMHFDRFFAEVVGMNMGMQEKLAALTCHASPVFKAVFGELTKSIDRLAVDPANTEDWIAAIVNYHLIAEAYLAFPRQCKLLRFLREAQLLPGFVAGFTGVTRDEVRHLDTGVHLLRGCVQRNAEAARTIAMKVLLLARAMLSAANTSGGQTPGMDSRRTVKTDSSTESLLQRLRLVGLSDLVLNEVTTFFPMMPRVASA
jgi:ribonucleotide reductase beta subunit family protein with ferritin-like domain